MDFQSLLSGVAASDTSFEEDVLVSAQSVINTPQELHTLLGSAIVKVRKDIVGPILVTKLCPAMLKNGSWVLFVLEEYEASTFIEVTTDKCRKEGARGAIDVFIVSQYILLNISTEEDGTEKVDVNDEERSGHLETFKDIIGWGLKNDASDVTLNVIKNKVLSQINFTIKGIYTAPTQWKMDTSRLREILNIAWQSGKGGGSSVFNPDIEQQLRIEMKIGNTSLMLRWASMAGDRGVSVTIRILKIDQDVKIRSLESQGFLPTQIAMFRRAQLSEGGAIILSGVVNSGKSTALAVNLMAIPATRKGISMEDPVEYVIPNFIQNTIVRSLEGNDEDSFLPKLKTIKRSAPNDLYLSEIRDRQTGDAFMDMSGSGTSLYTTLHAPSAMQIPERLSSKAIGIPSDLLASPGVLKLLVYQALLPKLCTHCALPIASLLKEGGVDGNGDFQQPSHWSKYIERIERIYGVSSSTINVRCAAGCSNCRNEELPQLNGYSDREVVAEFLEPNTDRTILRKIREQDTLGLKIHLESLQRSAIDDPDMTNKSLMECAMYKVFIGIFDPRDVEKRTSSFETVEMVRKQGKIG